MQRYCLNQNTTGLNNTTNGAYSLSSYITGSFNIAISWSLVGNTNGIGNTASGFYVLLNNSTGSYNTSLGTGADMNAGIFSNTILIEYHSRGKARNQVRVGSNSITSIGGQVGWNTLSDGRFKENIKDEDYKASSSNTFIGFIAQEVEAAANKRSYQFIGVHRQKNEDNTYSLRNAEFTVPLVKVVQGLSNENTQLKADVAALKNK